MTLGISTVMKWSASDLNSIASKLHDMSSQIVLTECDLTDSFEGLLSTSILWTGQAADAAYNVGTATVKSLDNVTSGLDHAASVLRTFAQSIEQAQQQIKASQQTVEAQGAGWTLGNDGSLNKPDAPKIKVDPTNPIPDAAGAFAQAKYNESLTAATNAATRATEALLTLQAADQRTSANLPTGFIPPKYAPVPTGTSTGGSGGLIPGPAGIIPTFFAATPAKTLPTVVRNISADMMDTYVSFTLLGPVVKAADFAVGKNIITGKPMPTEQRLHEIPIVGNKIEEYERLTGRTVASDQKLSTTDRVLGPMPTAPDIAHGTAHVAVAGLNLSENEKAVEIFKQILELIPK